MKIMIVTPYFYPKVGGLENYAFNIAKGLQKDYGHEVFVVTSNHAAKKYVDEEVEGLRVIRLPSSFKLSNSPINFRWYWQLKKIIKAEKPAIINAHSPVPGLADMAFLARGKTKFVITYHAGSMKKGTPVIDAVLGLYERTCLKYILKKSDSIVDYYPEFLEKILGKTHKINFIPPGIDAGLFKPEKKSENKFDVLFVGRIEKTSTWKGVDVLFKAVAELSKSIPNISLGVIGDGNAIDDYKKLADELGISKNVSFLGALRDKALVSAYNSAKMLVLPSKTDAESFGIVLIEAMACGIPVIGSKIGGIPNVITNGVNGLLVKPNERDVLAKAIKKLLEDKPLAQKLGSRGRNIVVEKFSLQSLIRNTEQLFKITAKPRIFQITAFYPPHLGGMEKVVEEISLELAERHYNVTVITSDIGYEADYHDSSHQNLTILRLRSTELAHLPIIWGLLPQLLRIPKKSILHVHIAQAFVPEMTMFVAKIKRIPFIAHVHLDVAPSGSFGFIFSAYKKTLFPIMLRAADQVVVFSEDQSRLMQQKYRIQTERVIVVPNGVSTKFFYDDLRNLHDKPRLLFVGRLSPQKNVQQFLEALTGVSERFETRIVGDGTQRAELQSLTKKLMLKNVVFCGRQNDDEIISSYKWADVFILPSEREGMPLVLLEAMAMSLPIIGTDVIGIRELIKDQKNGLLVPLGNPRAFRSALIKIVGSDEDYKKMNKISREIAEGYSLDNVSNKFEAIYAEYGH